MKSIKTLSLALTLGLCTAGLALTGCEDESPLGRHRRQDRGRRR